MNIKQVAYFVAVFDSGSFSIAARSCDVTVQAVSKAIHELEREFSTRFFDRSSQGVEPTLAGRAFYQKAVPALRAFEELERFDASTPIALEAPSAAQGCGTLSLGLCAPGFASSGALCQMLTAFVRKNIGIDTKLATIDPQQGVADLSAHRLDALISIGLYEDEGIDCVTVGTLPTGIVVARDHPLASRPSVRVAELEEYPAADSPVFDTFNRSILVAYRSRGMLKNIRTIETVAEEDPEFLHKDQGFFFSAVMPIPNQFGDDLVLVPIDAAENIDVPICLVTLKGQKATSYHLVESFLVQAVSGFKH